MLPGSTEVLVIGHGPVGAAISCLLGRQGVQTVVVDMAMDILPMPRAIALDNEALRVLQLAGLGEDAFARIPIPEVRMICPYVGLFNRVNTSGYLDGHPKLVTFYQPELERALRREAGRHASVSAHAGWELISFETVSDGVVVKLRHREGTEQDIKARYLVGADGASSRVRTLIGQDFKGETYSEDWLIVDAGQREHHAIDHVEFICDPSRPTPHMPAPGGRERWEFMLQPGETRAEMESPERIAELLKPWTGTGTLNIERKAVYRFHARCCGRFQQGRVFLAGDAAHITPPFVGQGLVAGLRDAANLAWKLKWALHHGASASLLESYDSERRPHAQRMINLAKLMGRMVMPSGRATAVLIHGGLKALRLLPSARSFFEELKVKPANTFDHGFFRRGAKLGELRAGAQLPQVVLRNADGQLGLSDDVLGSTLTLMGCGVDPREALSPVLMAAWHQAGGQFVQVGGGRLHGSKGLRVLEDVEGSWLAGLAPGSLLVIRPDHFILDMDRPGQAVRLVTRSLGRLKE